MHNTSVSIPARAPAQADPADTSRIQIDLGGGGLPRGPRKARQDHKPEDRYISRWGVERCIKAFRKAAAANIPRNCPYARGSITISHLSPAMGRGRAFNGATMATVSILDVAGDSEGRGAVYCGVSASTRCRTGRRGDTFIRKVGAAIAIDRLMDTLARRFPEELAMIIQREDWPLGSDPAPAVARQEGPPPGVSGIVEQI